MLIRALACAALLLPGAARSAPIDDAQAAYAAGDFPRAVALFRGLADEGNPVAQYNLGVLYENGQGLPKDYALAAQWYRKGADQGYSEAQNNLANMYAFGLGVKQDPAEAVVWMRKAAQQGQSGAQFNLGIMYTLGQGVGKDYAQAEAWLRLAAEQGEAEAQYNLGVMYERGDGVAADPVEAYLWYRTASEAGFAPAQQKLASVDASMTGEQRANAIRLMTARKAAAAAQAAAAAAPPRPVRSGAAVPLAVLGALALVAGAVWKIRGRKSGADSGAGAVFRELSEAQLLKAAENPKDCERIARFYREAGRAPDLACRKDGRTPKFYGAFSRAFLALGDLANALALVELKEPPEPADEILVWTLQKAVVDLAGASDWSWSAKLSTASDLSVQGLHAEAVSLVDDEMLQEAADNVGTSERVGALFAAAGRAAEFAARKPAPKRAA